MVNPGVIKLLSKEDVQNICGDMNKRFEIEDNLGEAIHIHFDNLRFDFSIKEFKSLSNKINEYIDELIDVPGFDSRDFNMGFIAANAEKFFDLEKVEKCEIELDELLIDTFDKDNNTCLKGIPFSRIYKSLNGDNAEDMLRKQSNFLNKYNRKMTNYERTESCLSNIREFGYPYNNEYIVIDKETRRIIDGQHRAACLYYLYGNKKVPVRALSFNKCQKIEKKSSSFEKLNEFIHAKKRIYLYGAGLWGRRFLFLLKYCGIEVDGFIITGMPKVRYYCGKEVYSLAEMTNVLTQNDGIVMSFEASKNFDFHKVLNDNSILAEVCSIGFNEMKKMYEEIM